MRMAIALREKRGTFSKHAALYGATVSEIAGVSVSDETRDHAILILGCVNFLIADYNHAHDPASSTRDGRRLPTTRTSIYCKSRDLESLVCHCTSDAVETRSRITYSLSQSADQHSMPLEAKWHHLALAV